MIDLHFNTLILKRLNAYTLISERFSFNILVLKRLNIYTLVPE